MEISEIEEKISDLESQSEKEAEYMRVLQILQTYKGEDRVVRAEDLYKEVAEENKGQFLYKTGLTRFDDLVGGFKEGQLCVVSAPTGMGKTTFLQTLTMLYSVQKINSLWFSYEVGIQEFLDKFPSIPVCYMPRRIKQNSLSWLENRIKEGVAKYNTKIVFIDHLHYLLEMQRMAEAKSISLLVGMMMRDLKRIAIENNLIIFLVSHMRKSLYRVEKAENLPDIDDLRDSSFVGQESDMVLFLYRRPEKDDNGVWFFTNETLLKVAKNRRTGNLGCVKLIFKDKMFQEMTTQKLEDQLFKNENDDN